MNQILIMGRLTRDPEFRTTENGKYIAKYTVADNNGNAETIFHNCVAWDNNAEFARSWLHKGTSVIVVGSEEQHTYNDKKYKQVKVDKAYFTESRKKAEEWSDMTDDEELPF